MTYGRPETIQSLNKRTTQNISNIFNAVQNSQQKNTLLKSTGTPTGRVQDTTAVDSPTNVVVIIDTPSGDIPLPLTTPGLGGFILPSIDDDVTIMFMGDVPTAKFDFTIQLGFVQEEILDEEGEIITPTVTFPDTTVGVPEIDSNTGNTTKLVFNTLDMGLTWSVTNSIGIFDGLDIGMTLAGIRAWIDGLPDATMNSPGFLQVFPSDHIALKVMKGIIHERDAFVQFMVEGVVGWLESDESGIFGDIWTIWKDTLEGVLDWVENLPTTTMDNEIEFLRVQDGDHIAVKVLKGIANDLPEFVKTVAEGVKGWLEGDESGILGVLYRSISTTLIGVFEWIDATFVGPIRDFVGYLKTTYDTTNENDSVIIRTLNTIRAVIGDIGDLVLNWWNNSENSVVAFLRDYITTPISEFLGYLKTTYDATNENDSVITRTLNTIRAVIGDIGELVLNWWNNSENVAVAFLRDYVTEPIGEFLQYLGDSYNNSTQTTVAGKTLDVFSKIVVDIGAIIGRWISENATAIFNGVQSAIEGAYTWLKTDVFVTATNIVAGLGQQWEDILSIANNTLQRVLGIIQAAYPWVVTTIEGAMGFLETNALSAWNWLVSLTEDGGSLIIDAIDRAAEFFKSATAAAEGIAGSISEGATDILTSLQELLFDDTTPLAFAEEAATGQIMHEIDDDDGTIKAAIDNEIVTALNAWRDAIGLAAAETIGGIATGIESFFDGLSGGGGETADISDLANRHLSNLESVTRITRPLTFETNTDSVGSTNSIGYDVGNSMFLKTRQSSDSFFFQSGGITQLELKDKSLRIGRVASFPGGSPNGTIAAVGDTVVVKMHGKPVDLSTLVGTGGEVPETSFGFTPLTEDQREAGAFWVPLKAYTTGNVTVSFLEEAFGSVMGSCGVVFDPDQLGSPSSTIRFCIKMPYSDGVAPAWYLFNANGRHSSIRNTGVRYNLLTYGRKRISIGGGPDSNFPSPYPSGDSRFFGYYNDDNDLDGRISWSQGTNLSDRKVIPEDSVLNPAGNFILPSDVSAIPNLIPYREDLRGSSFEAEQFFGNDDGYVGISRDDVRLYVKIAGYWYYWRGQ